MLSHEKQTPELHPKGWGYELWIHNSSAYCGKLLIFNEGKKCSWHYHVVKEETFYLQSGRIELRFGDSDDLHSSEMVVLNPGDSFHVPAGLRHQMLGLERSELFEISTEHWETDSIRVIKGD